MPGSHPVVYPRNGFGGPFAFTAKPHYVVDYVHAEGNHTPHRFDPSTLTSTAYADPRTLPVPVLREPEGHRLSIATAPSRAASVKPLCPSPVQSRSRELVGPDQESRAA
ncbi:hypothetical protein ABZ848_48975 [Streptomyces sp. NPDC047081]|uniref:hypothetical protein n=1 Tax=Streptomyces sp. NPDC047081 TaxID=3154706 RepID=UPI0033D075E2